MVQEITKQDFDKRVSKAKGLIVLKFYRAQGCPNCQTMAPVFDEFSELHKDIKCFQINVDENKEVAQNFQFRLLPGIFFIEDGKSFFQTEGVVNQEQLGLPFRGTENLKSIAYDLDLAVKQAKEAEKLLPTINSLIARQQARPLNVTPEPNGIK